MWTALFFPLDFDEVAHDSRRKGTDRNNQQPDGLARQTSPPFLPTRPTSTSSNEPNRGGLNATLRQGWLKVSGKGRR